MTRFAERVIVLAETVCANEEETVCADGAATVCRVKSVCSFSAGITRILSFGLKVQLKDRSVSIKIKKRR